MAKFTIQDITELRKSGKLQEALSMSEELFASFKNKYTATALFWCLYKQCKRASSESELNSCLQKMRELFEQYSPDDDLMSKFIGSIEKRLETPLFIEIHNATEQAKNGIVDFEKFRSIEAKFEENAPAGELTLNFGWLIYYSIKAMKLKGVNQQKTMLGLYLNLNLSRPSVIHSLILGEALKLKRADPMKFRLRNFMKLWGWENLSEQDWEQYKSPAGNVVSSPVEKIIALCWKEVKIDRTLPPKEYETLLDQAIERFPNNPHLPLYKANLLIMKGKRSQALEFYKNLLIKSPSKFYLWKQAAELANNLELSTAMLCKAISVGKNEEFMGNCRLRLCQALIKQGLRENAKFELERYKQFYQDKGWHLKWEVAKLDKMLSSVTASKENRKFYQQYVPLAEEFVYSDIEAEIAVKVNQKTTDDFNRPQSKILLWTLRTVSGVVSMKFSSRFGVPSTLPDGSILEIKQIEGKIVKLKILEEGVSQPEWIKKAKGPIRKKTNRNGKPYCIIEGLYVSEKLLLETEDGDQVEVTAIKKEEGTWTVVGLRKIK